jgi:hypothetical protein
LIGATASANDEQASAGIIIRVIGTIIKKAAGSDKKNGNTDNKKPFHKTRGLLKEKPAIAGFSFLI